MSAKTDYVMVVLFEDEIRLAAKAIKALIDMPEDTPDEEQDRLTRNAALSCWHALAEADRDDVVLVLGRKPEPPK